MTPKMIRAVRAYLIGPAAMRQLLVALNALIFPTMFSRWNYVPLVNLVPRSVWLIILCAIGLFCLIAGISANLRLARIGLITSATATFTVGAGVVILSTFLAFRDLALVSASVLPLIGVLILALSAADYIVLAIRWTPEPPAPTLPAHS
jgi:hypothetical protein